MSHMKFTKNRLRCSVKEVTTMAHQYAGELKYDVTQVSQFLTDVSATGDPAQLKDAEEYYKLFKTNSTELLMLQPGFKSRLDDISKSFDDMYKTGLEMAKAYINNDTNTGNIKMSEFDKALADISGKAAEIQNESQSIMMNDFMTVDMHMSMNQTWSIIIAIMTILLSAVIVIVLGNSITNPIKKLLGIFKELSNGQGDLTARITLNSKDEISQMGRAFNLYMDSLEKMVSNIKGNAAVVSEGAGTLSINGELAANEVKRLNDHMISITKETQDIGESIKQITSSVSDIARASQDTAADAQKICSEAGNIDNLAQKSGSQSLATKKQMEKVENISEAMVGLAQKLENEAGEIGKIVDTINAITDQTNLLALNAAIEAARAGEEGRGFGVVADEIRRLAESNKESVHLIENIVITIQNMIKETIKATGEVGSNIRTSTGMVNNVYEQLSQITQGISSINERIQSIAAGTQEQSASTEELSATMETINSSNTQIGSAIQKFALSISKQAETIGELSKTASSLNNSSDNLNSLVERFKINEI